MITSCLWLFPDWHLPSGRRRRVGEILFEVGLLYAALAFVPWVLAASARTLHLDADGTPAVLDHPVGWWLVWGAIENIGFFAILLSWVVWVAVQVPQVPEVNRRAPPATEVALRGRRRLHRQPRP